MNPDGKVPIIAADAYCAMTAAPCDAFVIMLCQICDNIERGFVRSRAMFLTYGSMALRIMHRPHHFHLPRSAAGANPIVRNSGGRFSVGQDDQSQSTGEGSGLPSQLVEALLLLGQGNFSYRLPRTLSRDNDDTVAFCFNSAAENLERMIQQSRDKETRILTLINRVSEALVSVASGDLSVQVERDFQRDPADLLAFLVNNTITELAQLVADSDRRAVDDRQRLEELVDARTRELQVLASIDEVTGILNRRRILAAASEECQRMARYPEALCFAMFDIDHFKLINDAFGHSVGDRALRLVAVTARSQLRLQDRIGRYGGEEFLIVFPETSLEGAARVTERVRAAIESLELNEGGFRATLSISAGVGEVARAETLDAVLRRVDSAMYRAKSAGRNQVVRVPLPAP